MNDPYSMPAQGLHPTRDVVLCGVGFLVATCAYYVTSAYQGAVNKQLGIYSLATVYAAYGICSLVVPAIARDWPAKLSLYCFRYVFMVGAFFHVLYVVASIYVRPASIIIAAALGGVGAAVLWPVSGMFITRKSTLQTLGRNNGIFWTIYVTSIPAGNLFASVFLIIYDNTKTLFIIMAITGILSLIPFMFLEWKECALSTVLSLNPRSPKPAPSTQTDPDRLTVMEYLCATLRFLWTTRFLLFTVYIAYSGGIITLVYSMYGPKIRPTKYIGFGVAAFGLADVLGGVSFGPLSDRVGRVPVLILGFVLSMASIAVGSQGSEERIWPLLIALVLLGFADAANQTQITAILPVLAGDPKLVGAAFGWRSFIGAVSQAILYGISGVLTQEVRQVIIIVLATVGNAIILFEDRFYLRLTPPTRKQLIKSKSTQAMSMQKLTVTPPSTNNSTINLKAYEPPSTSTTSSASEVPVSNAPVSV